jgi:sugar phosphate isomerase/epimerase
MTLSRRHFLTLSAALPWALSARASSTSIPVGLELYSVRGELKKNPDATVRSVAQMGYQVVEFYGPYFEWSEAQTKQMRKLLDDLGIRCLSTHNDEANLSPQKLDRARDLNLILGSKYVVQAWSDPKSSLDQWEPVADRLNQAAEKLEPAGLHVGYHNHNAEFTGAKGQRPIDLIAKSTKPSVVLQLDVGTCLEAGGDPVEWIKSNPGRIRSMHCKDWSSDPAKAYKVLFGEGAADWTGIFKAAEDVGGVEYYLVEQEGSRYSEFDTAKKCLQAFQKKHLK